MAILEATATILHAIVWEAVKTVSYMLLFVWALIFAMLMDVVVSPPNEPGGLPPAVYYQQEEYDNQSRMEPLTL